ncbi:MAG: 50S ribosome-binding GTPase [Candidatus Dadabacteria bacterium]|nr:50S ribosome-binding GTPase [Candidatus Dadabacteria bacterium]
MITNFKRLLGQSNSCDTCSQHIESGGAELSQQHYLITVAGNPNTGKSTLFNGLTGLKQHVGNWPGKTVMRAEGGFRYGTENYKIVDLPGTYSLLAGSVEEEIARDFILFEDPDAVIVVMDATAVERNLNLTLQILEITDHVVVALNLMDEARRKGITIDHKGLSKELGVPVIPTVARTGEGIGYLMQAVSDLVEGRIQTNPRRIQLDHVLEEMVNELVYEIKKSFPHLKNSRWIALRLLDGDSSIYKAFETGEIEDLFKKVHPYDLKSTAENPA